ncbi:MAG: stage III sporulation protein AB [Lachnospiraceae bacterium]|nr:stage III sporulation protein AB [Lachnospiraceae bacterium]
MAKLIGSVLILSACIGYAGALAEKQEYHRDVLLSLIRILSLLAGEIRYERLTMAEALGRLTEKYHGPAGEVMKKIADRLREASCGDLESVWRFYFQNEQRRLMLSGEELDILLETGRNLGYLDAEAQVSHLHRCRERLEQKLEEAEKVMAEKRRLYAYLSVAVGVMVILVLL